MVEYMKEPFISKLHFKIKKKGKKKKKKKEKVELKVATYLNKKI